MYPPTQLPLLLLHTPTVQYSPPYFAAFSITHKRHYSIGHARINRGCGTLIGHANMTRLPVLLPRVDSIYVPTPIQC